MAILNLSKLHMFKCYYDVLKTKFTDKVMLAYTHTDSFVIHVETDDLYKDLKPIKNHMDFSRYPKDHVNYDISIQNYDETLYLKTNSICVRCQVPKPGTPPVRCLPTNLEDRSSEIHVLYIDLYTNTFWFMRQLGKQIGIHIYTLTSRKVQIPDAPISETCDIAAQSA